MAMNSGKLYSKGKINKDSRLTFKVVYNVFFLRLQLLRTCILFKPEKKTKSNTIICKTVNLYILCCIITEICHRAVLSLCLSECLLIRYI